METPVETPPQPRGTRRFGGLNSRAVTALTAFGLVGGGLVGGFTVANAASALTPTSAPASTSAAASSGTTPHTWNEDPAHEAGESAAREAAENNGTATFGPPGGTKGTPSSP